jgi:hypothetical protein
VGETARTPWSKTKIDRRSYETELAKVGRLEPD